ncbi:MAG: ATP-dependent transcriptional regulator, MalT-like, LuxR family [Acidimicrobiales bacterium]|nr:ATP-dependent transcriptional regulator, MalT-like, LuxR family [Acidimicrobiales bacterium]
MASNVGQTGWSVTDFAPSPLLETKFHVPWRRRELVARPRLSDRLNGGKDSALTLVSAPAGFGKTTLLTEWLDAGAGGGRATAWLSLDQSDNDPALFWAYLVAALRTAVPGIGASALALLSSQSSIAAALAALLNELRGIETDVVLVLDDYHVIDTPDIHEGISFLLEHLPPELHLVIASRADPPLPLARLRARGDLVEIRAADLRFTPDEAATYLEEVMGLVLTADDVISLEARTEGWIAALQLAALSMQGRDDIAAFIAGFAGDDRYVVDYLVGEVLQRQPDHVRSFLLRTSILSRLNGSLCDALTGQKDGMAMLEALDRANLFLVALDDQRRWYRYHHLFGDMLRARLLDEEPDLVKDLHRRASDWYVEHGERAEAIHHAMAGEDFERAADLVELALPAMRQGRQEDTLRRWLEVLPEELFQTRPVLSVGLVGALMATGDMKGVEARLRDAERWVNATEDRALGSGSPVIVDEDGFRGLPGAIAMYRAGLARLSGDIPGTMTHARRALEVVGDHDHAERGGAASLLGLTYWTIGDLEAAQRWYGEGMASLERAGYHADVVGGAITLADIRIAQGRLRDAMTTYERGLERASEQGPSLLRGAADMHVGMSMLFLERNDLDAAREHLAASRELGESKGFPQYPHRWRIATAAVRAVEGDLAAALGLLDEADRVYNGDFSPNVRPIAALKTRVRLAQGEVDDALAWVHEQQLSVEDDLTYVREFEHITLARVLIAEAPGRSIEDAIRLLGRLLAAAEAGGRTGSVIEILALHALALHRHGDVSGAPAPLERALTLAEPEGYVRVFLDEGPSMTTLLRTAARQGGASYARRVLASAEPEEHRAPVQRGLVEALSERELDVLRLLRSELDGPDIARELTVSLNTMRTHTKSIYAKLGVNSRRAAVRRADELGL